MGGYAYFGATFFLTQRPPNDAHILQGLPAVKLLCFPLLADGLAKDAGKVLPAVSSHTVCTVLLT